MSEGEKKFLDWQGLERQQKQGKKGIEIERNATVFDRYIIRGMKLFFFFTMVSNEYRYAQMRPTRGLTFFSSSRKSSESFASPPIFTNLGANVKEPGTRSPPRKTLPTIEETRTRTDK